jgi:serine/threonine-protein kinase
MATVFAARQVGARGASRVVALKVMATALADDPAAQRMFAREAVIATRVEHPNIVRTYEVGEVSGEIFLAMELVQGAPLSAICARTPGGVPIPIAVRIAADIARGLHAVHELRDSDGRPLGVVHQDVTPHNVVVGYDGTTKLLDFGVARMLARDGSRTERVRGKPAYLAPEQVLLERIDRRADIYALGAVLFELLTGARSSATASAFDARGPVDVRKLRAEVPDAIADVVARALRVEPPARYATADEMRCALGLARDLSRVASVDESEVAAWVLGCAPPAWSLEDLERELSTDEAYRAELAAVADLPTLTKAAPSNGVPPAGEVRKPVRRRWMFALAGAALFALVGGSAAVTYVVTRPGPAPPPADVVVPLLPISAEQGR